MRRGCFLLSLFIFRDAVFISLPMKHRVRIYLALALSLMLVVTGQGMAVARGMRGPAGQMVICTGSGPVMVSVDEKGQPTGPAHICPDGALSLIQAAFDAPEQVTALDRAARLVFRFRGAHLADVARAAQQARAPPVRA